MELSLKNKTYQHHLLVDYFFFLETFWSTGLHCPLVLPYPRLLILFSMLKISLIYKHQKVSGFSP